MNLNSPTITYLKNKILDNHSPKIIQGIKIYRKAQVMHLISQERVLAKKTKYTFTNTLQQVTFLTKFLWNPIILTYFANT